MFTIVQDTREQIPLDFSFYTECDGIEKRKLDTGDYSIVGREQDIFIERKRTTAELAINLGVDKERFYKELERAKNIKWKYILCEFTINDILAFPENSGIPKYKWPSIKFRGKAMYTLCKKIESDYGISFVFCENANDAANELIKIFTMIEESEGVGF